jgi:predicted DNA-binding WGR domain protein
MKRLFIYQDGASNKFWNIKAIGSKCTVTFGKIGTAGQTQTEEFESEEQCTEEIEKIINEKLKTGCIDEPAHSNSGQYEQENGKTGDNTSTEKDFAKAKELGYKE